MRLRCIPWGSLGLFAFTLGTACFSQCCDKIFDKSHRRNGLFGSYAGGIVHDSQREVVVRPAHIAAAPVPAQVPAGCSHCVCQSGNMETNTGAPPLSFFLFIQTGDSSP